MVSATLTPPNMSAKQKNGIALKTQFATPQRPLASITPKNPAKPPSMAPRLTSLLKMSSAANGNPARCRSTQSARTIRSALHRCRQRKAPPRNDPPRALWLMERFCGVLIEHFAGSFPTWLAPEQVRILPMNDDLVPQAREIETSSRPQNCVTVDAAADKLGAKIANATSTKS